MVDNTAAIRAAAQLVAKAEDYSLIDATITPSTEDATCLVEWSEFYMNRAHARTGTIGSRIDGLNAKVSVVVSTPFNGIPRYQVRTEGVERADTTATTVNEVIDLALTNMRMCHLAANPSAAIDPVCDWCEQPINDYDEQEEVPADGWSLTVHTWCVNPVLTCGADDLTEHTIVVAIDVNARTRREAAHIVSALIEPDGPCDILNRWPGVVDCWWFPESWAKQIDGNDRAAQVLINE